MNHVLIVDDEAGIRESLEAILHEEDYVITTAGTAAEAPKLLRDAHYHSHGIDAVAPIPGVSPHPPLPGPPEVIMVSGPAAIEAAARATKLGAYDFLEK